MRELLTTGANALLIACFALGACARPAARHPSGAQAAAAPAQGAPADDGMREEAIVVDSRTIAAGDVQALIEPLWWSVNIYDSWAEYEATLKPFTERQRHLFAIQWYRSEVSNGGHAQFVYNSTGIVWEHALVGFEAIGVAECAAILRAVAARLGGVPRDRQARWAKLDASDANFDDLDARFFEIEETGVLNRKMLAMAREHPLDFYFKGTIRRRPSIFPLMPAAPDNNDLLTLR